MKQVDLPNFVKIHEVRDNCNAGQNVSLELLSLGISDEYRSPLYQGLRTRFRIGQERSAVEELQMIATEHWEYPRIQTKVNNLRED